MIHDRRFFYKYVTAETALTILQNQTLKYSSPVLFNDPSTFKQLLIMALLCQSTIRLSGKNSLDSSNLKKSLPV